MPRPGSASRITLSVLWLVLGTVMIGVPIWLAVTRSDPLINGHPAMIATAGGCLMLGVVAVVWAGFSLVAGARYDATGDPEHPRRRTPAQQARRAVVRVVLAIPALILSLILVAWLVYARPFAATPQAVAALRSDAQVRVADRPTWYELAPGRRSPAGELIRPTVGLVFVPGARVDARAYAPVLRSVAAAGFLVIVIKEPFGFAIPTSKRPAELMDLHPDIRYWAVGGHSLGGVNAATFADKNPRVSGLLLYASYPGSAMTRGSLKVASISGDADGLATPADIEASRSRLPPTTSFVVIKGGIHAYFADYGVQPGDGTPGIRRAQAQAQIVKATTALLTSLTPPRRTR